jgi:hypothetical protein
MNNVSKNTRERKPVHHKNISTEKLYFAGYILWINEVLLSYLNNPIEGHLNQECPRWWVEAVQSIYIHSPELQII